LLGNLPIFQSYSLPLLHFLSEVENILYCNIFSIVKNRKKKLVKNIKN